MQSLLALGIETKIIILSTSFTKKCSEHLGYKNGDIPNAENFARSMISLPIYHTLNDDEVEYIINSLNKTINQFL